MTDRESSPPAVPPPTASSTSVASAAVSAARRHASSLLSTTTTAHPTSASPPSTVSSSVKEINVPLSVLIADMQRAHKHHMSHLKEVAEANHKQASASATSACQSLVDVSNAEVIEIFNAEAKIEAQIKELSQQAEGMHKRMSQWAQVFLKFNHSLKEVGDVQHWAHMVETDMSESVRILEAVCQKKRQLMGVEPMPTS